MHNEYSFMSWNMHLFQSNYAVCTNWINEKWLNNLLLLVPNCYEVVIMVASSGRYVCGIVVSYTQINKAVSQKLLTLNLCISVTWLLTCASHIPCPHTPEIIDIHRGVCDKLQEE